MKKILVVLFTLMCFIPSIIFAEENAKVKVYIFEAGECPYCEMELEYLEKLPTYNKKFEIVRKELYVDHENWEHGKDYDLAVKLVKAFRKAGFDAADYEGTPFVIISDIYASTGYSEDLSAFIDEAYEEGDSDIVSCAIAEEECRIGNIQYDFGAHFSFLAIIIIFVLFTGGIVAMLTLGKKTNEIEGEEVKKEFVMEKPLPKKATSKKSSTKKAPVKKATAKKEPVKKASKTTTKKVSNTKTSKKSTTKKTNKK